MAEFVQGQFQQYSVTRKFHIGAIEADVQPGEVLEFDGTTVRLGGKEGASVSLRGAIITGLLTQGDASSVSTPPPTSRPRARPPRQTGRRFAPAGYRLADTL